MNLLNSKMRYFLWKSFGFFRTKGLNKIFLIVLKPILCRNHKYRLHNNILLEKNKAIYFVMPKVASSSLKNIFLNVLGFRNEGINTTQLHEFNFPYANLKDLDTKYKDYYKFSFVRNPYDRVVSCYKNRILKEKINDSIFINGVHYNFLSLGNFYAGMSFEDFVIEICKIDDKYADNHFRTQLSILSDNDGNLLVDHIFKFENLDKNFNKLKLEIGIDENIKLDHLMKSEHKPYRDYYTEKTKKLIKKKYKKDLEKFGYEF